MRTFYKSSFYLKNLSFLGLFSPDFFFKKLAFVFGSSFKNKFKNKFLLNYLDFFNKYVLYWWCKIKPIKAKFRNSLYFSKYFFLNNYENVIGSYKPVQYTILNKIIKKKKIIPKILC